MSSSGEENKTPADGGQTSEEGKQQNQNSTEVSGGTIEEIKEQQIQFGSTTSDLPAGRSVGQTFEYDDVPD